MIKLKNSRRKYLGSGLAEFGPALFIIFILLFFPMVDLIQSGVAYMACSYINDQQLIALANSLQVQTSAATGGSAVFSSYSLNNAVTRVNNVRTFFNSSAFSKLAHAQPLPTITQANIGMPSYNATENTYYVSFTTSITANPFLFIPFFNGVPGIGAPVTYTVSGQKLVETIIAN